MSIDFTQNKQELSSKRADEKRIVAQALVRTRGSASSLRVRRIVAKAFRLKF